MKELEKRIDNIDQGHLDRLLKEYDYHLMLANLMSSMNEDLRVAMKPVGERLLKKVIAILNRSTILQNTAIKALDFNWEIKLDEEHSKNYAEFGKEEPDFYRANLLGEVDEEAHINHFIDKMMKFVDAPEERKQQQEYLLREELEIYKTILQGISDVNTTVVNGDHFPDIYSFSSTEVPENNEMVERIKAKLDSVKNNLTSQDLDILAEALQQYITSEQFPELVRPIQVFDCKNVKRFGWAVNRVLTFHNKKLKAELLVFASKYISIYIGEQFDPENFRNSKLYKYFTTKVL